MATSKWKAPDRITAIIGLMEEQTDGGQLLEYGVKEHRYMLVQLVRSFGEVRKLKVQTVVMAKDGKPELKDGKVQMAESEQDCVVLSPAAEKDMRKFFADQSNFVCYASNAKKLLIEDGALDAKAVMTKPEYE